MNDQYGDPRNYDPNVVGYDPYQDPNVWGPEPQPFDFGGAPAPPAAAPPPSVVPPPGGGGGGKTPAQIEAEGREYDRMHGLVGGYMMNGQWVSGSPTSSTGGGGGREGGGTGQFDYGRPVGNQFSAYSPLSWSPFSYGEYTPTDRNMLWDDSQNPGFKKSMDRLQKMIEAGAAYRGMLRSGMTIGNLDSVLGSNEEAQFKGLDDRRFRNWSANRDNAFGSWNANLGVAERENQRSNDFRFNTEKATADDILSRWQTLVNSATTLARPS